MQRIFSREHKCLRMSNFCVTNSRINVHITLPKVLPADKEVYINLKRETFMKTMKKYLKKYKQTKIKMNITRKQYKGYRRIMRRLKNGEFKMALIDKSNNSAVIGFEEYLKIGGEHMKKDKKVTLEEAKNLAKKSDQHTSMILKIFNLGHIRSSGISQA